MSDTPLIDALRCDCGSDDAVMCIDPGADATTDLFGAGGGVAARGWCAQCFASFAALLPHEAPKRGRRAHV